MLRSKLRAAIFFWLERHGLKQQLRSLAEKTALSVYGRIRIFFFAIRQTDASSARSFYFCILGIYADAGAPTNGGDFAMSKSSLVDRKEKKRNTVAATDLE